MIGVNDLALDLVGPSTVISQAASDHRNINLGHAKGLSIVQGLESSQLVGISVDQLRELDEVAASLFWSDLAP